MIKILKPYHPYTLSVFFGTYTLLCFACIGLLQLIDGQLATDLLEYGGFSILGMGCMIFMPREISSINWSEVFSKCRLSFVLSVLLHLFFVVLSIIAIAWFCTAVTDFTITGSADRNDNNGLFLSASLLILFAIIAAEISKLAYERTAHALFH
ncbi:hypothetical protein LMH73_009180 [Vibrio splendidus]|nr:hypothetical protein [Vibrio splendidus]MCC4880303.1 hypothetical protein [Vibrio splendidus]